MSYDPWAGVEAQGDAAYDDKPYGSMAKQSGGAIDEDTIVVTGTRPERRGFFDRVLGGVAFGAGALVGFVRDTAQGLLSLGDFVVRDMGGTVLYGINEAIDFVIPGDLPNPYRQSYVDYTNAVNTGANLVGRVFGDFDGLVSDVRVAFADATARSNAQDSAFARGASNPTASVILNIATLPLAITKVRAVSELGQAGRLGRVEAGVGAARAAEAGQAARAAAVVAEFAPETVRFSQSSVSFTKFRNGLTYTYDEIREAMAARNGWVGEAADVVRMQDGLLTSMDNTRLRAALSINAERAANGSGSPINILARERAFDEALTSAEMGRFTRRGQPAPRTWGDVATARIQTQTPSSWVAANQYGSYSWPRLTRAPAGYTK